ncbi:hypothetical protein CIPAW_08G143400 [Carya illinoinensis]|uniref:RNase H type-1 domain-containing protein n=1 Tax=Carya illinoinensis TaxID=32201 RepID=A0A8T1PWF2_CARIL|nr:hypothetical protein CIPAW_08G143400 [Carya illinoinensis]
MPVHLLSVVHALKAVLSKICNLISNFFWGSSGGKSKHKWINWQWVCKPVREGGMGLRCLEEVQISLLMKFFWNLLTSNSLWVQYFKAKYVKHMHISLVGQQRGTWFWKGILHCLPRVLSNSKWQIQDGKLFFWHDNWSSIGPLVDTILIAGSPNLQVKSAKFMALLFGLRHCRELGIRKVEVEMDSLLVVCWLQQK